MLPRKRAPIHPGEILEEEFLKPLSISQEKFVTHLGGTWTQPKISAIICGRRDITEAIALDFADALGTSAQFWINLQTRYDLWHEQKRHKKVPLLPALRRKRRSTISRHSS
ncbi:MAG: HigA family addiction module antitoxin [Chlamydiales bacterium]